MRALRFHGQRDLRLDDIPEPVTRPGTVKVQVHWNGICGSDLHEYLAGPIYIPTPGHPHPLTGETLPVVMGHEFAGEVVEVGEGVTAVAVGDNVAADAIIRDSSCPACRHGAYNHCEQIGFLGISGFGGGLAEYAVIPAANVHPLPQGMSTELGALVDPTAVGWHAVRQSGITPGQSALVLGGGPIGLVTAASLKAQGAGWVGLTEPAPGRRDLAKHFGADAVFDPTTTDVVAAVRDAVPGGVDAAFDCSGLPVTLKTAIGATRTRGTVVNVAIWEGPTEFHLNDLVFSEVLLTGCIGYSGDDHPETIQALASGQIDAGQLVTARIGLAEAVELGFEELATNRDRHTKILIDPRS